jgi:hypothetical protein
MATTGIFGGMNEWLKKPENQLLLAGAGQKLDPQGVGGALGGATGAYLQSNIAAERAQKQEASQNEQRKMLTDVLARMADPNGNALTPKGQPGPTSVSANPDGSLKILADVGPGSTANQLATPTVADPQTPAAPNTAVSPAGANMLNQGTQETPLTLPGTTVTAQREPPVQVAQAQPTKQPFDIRSVIPFY